MAQRPDGHGDERHVQAAREGEEQSQRLGRGDAHPGEHPQQQHRSRRVGAGGDGELSRPGRCPPGERVEKGERVAVHRGDVLQVLRRSRDRGGEPVAAVDERERQGPPGGSQIADDEQPAPAEPVRQPAPDREHCGHGHRRRQRAAQANLRAVRPCKGGRGGPDACVGVHGNSGEQEPQDDEAGPGTGFAQLPPPVVGLGGCYGCGRGRRLLPRGSRHVVSLGPRHVITVTVRARLRHSTEMGRGEDRPRG